MGVRRPGPIQKLSALVPQPLRAAGRRIAYFGLGEKCPLCSSSIRGFVDDGGGFEVLERRKVVGAAHQAGDRCPVCHGVTRTRLLRLYLERLLANSPGRLEVLHLAPEWALSCWLRKLPSIGYVPADLDVARYRHIPGITRADLESLPFADKRFDIVICSHVLEHVPDDRVAMREIARVVKPGGAALLFVPLAMDGGKTDEDPSIADVDERERRFGQFDHVRLYTPDVFLARLKEAGLEVRSFDPRTDDPEAARRWRITTGEKLTVAARQASSRP